MSRTLVLTVLLTTWLATGIVAGFVVPLALGAERREEPTDGATPPRSYRPGPLDPRAGQRLGLGPGSSSHLLPSKRSAITNCAFRSPASWWKVTVMPSPARRCKSTSSWSSGPRVGLVD
jgi:hypothetical protein